MRAKVLLGVVVLFACDRGANPKAECGPSADAFLKTIKLGAKDDPAKVKAAVAQRCVDDHWLPELRRCLASTKATLDRYKCMDDHMTGDQREKLEKQLEPLLITGPAEAMAKMEEFKTKMCACKDAKCAQGVSDEMTEWSQEMARTMKEPTRMSKDDQRKAAAIGEEMGRCMQTAMGVGGDTTPTMGAVEALAAMEGFKTKMCACADKKCALAVSDEMTRWSQKQANEMREPPRMTEEQTKQAAALGEAMGKCMEKAMASK